jgi:stearoyl-CoA desaturase (Delta-9 desaturase)
MFDMAGWRRALLRLSSFAASPATMEPAVGIARKAAGSYRNVEWIRNLPYFFMHAACLGVLWVGFSWTAAAVALALYVVRMFFITGFYHRYFSHRTYRVSRPLQTVMAVLGLTCVQRGPLWWAAHHRHHHAHSDHEEDLHSPTLWGVLWAHMFWFTTADALPTRSRYVRDLEKFPELVWLDRHENAVYVAFAGACYGLGCLLHVLGWQPGGGYGHAGLQILVWGFFVSTVALYHGTYTINSLSHLFGSRRYETADTSRNNWLLSIITLGEGWHNNHHHYQASARQGFYWWEWDPTYYALKAMSWMGLVKNLRGVPDAVRSRPRRRPAVTPAPGA